MYKREIQERITSPIKDGKPLFGTWYSAFDEVDFLKIRRPFSFPLPRMIRDLRIKEWQTFTVQDDNFFLVAVFSNLKYYCWTQVFLYDKDTKETLRFRKIIPFSRWRMPQPLSNSSIDSRSYGFFFRIHDWLDADIIKIDLDIEATSKRPSFTAHLEYTANRQKITPMAVNLPITDQRPMYVYKIVTSVRGDMVFGGRHLSYDPTKTTGLFADFKGFFPYSMYYVGCTGLGFDEENRRFGFSIAENQTKETFKNNENAFWLKGKITPLPPVRITMPNGIEADWVIQDMEGMVDLVFTPQEYIHSSLNLIISNTEYTTPMGYYNGVIVDSSGNSVSIRNLWGLGEKMFIRI